MIHIAYPTTRLWVLCLDGYTTEGSYSCWLCRIPASRLAASIHRSSLQSPFNPQRSLHSSLLGAEPSQLISLAASLDSFIYFYFGLVLGVPRYPPPRPEEAGSTHLSSPDFCLRGKYDKLLYMQQSPRFRCNLKGMDLKTIHTMFLEHGLSVMRFRGSCDMIMLQLT